MEVPLPTDREDALHPKPLWDDSMSSGSRRVRMEYSGSAGNAAIPWKSLSKPGGAGIMQVRRDASDKAR